MKTQVFNPYLPCYEYIPDGEPRVFGDRLYIFGSHDKFNGKTFCENDYVTWSCPVDDLSDWRYEGVIYTRNEDPYSGNLYAPDVIQGLDNKYYLFYCKSDVSVISVAVCDEPAGKYEYIGDVRHADGRILGEADDELYQFDPSILIDDGHIYLYSGSGQYNKQNRFKQKLVGCMVMELEKDMLTLKSKPKVLLPGAKNYNKKAFFEGASARKINGLYYLVFPAMDMTGLNYATSSYPDRDFVIRGSIHSTSDVGINGHSIVKPAYPLGNNHGGLVNIKGQWYIFDHRMTNGNSFSRQGVAEPVKIEADGSIRQVEATSCGLNGGPLKDEGTYPASIACNLMGFLVKSPFITQDLEDGNEAARQYVTGIRRYHKVGYKYFDLTRDQYTLTIEYMCTGKGNLEVMQNEKGKCIGKFDVEVKDNWTKVSCTIQPVKGKSALFFQYKGYGDLSIREFSWNK